MRNTRHNPICVRAATLLTLALLIASPFSGCMNDGGTELPNEVRGTLYTTNGSPAANATVTLYPVSYVPGTSTAKRAAVKMSTQTDASGQFAIPEVPEGEYNILATGNDLYAFQDSVALTPGFRNLPSDTLRAAGTLTGTVQLQPQHSPQTATVQVLGTDYYTNVAADGRFTLTLPRGNYRLRVSTILVDYVPLFVSVTARSGIHDTLAEPLEPFYANIPVVTGLTARADSTGIIVLKWNKPKFGNVQKYLIYRDLVGTVTPSTTPYKSAEDTSFLDTIYARMPGSAMLNYFDTTTKAYSYRVRILDVSDNVGPIFGSASTTSFPPAKLYVSGKWTKALNNLPFSVGLEDVKLAVFQGELWGLATIWTAGSGRRIESWRTLDGISWTKASTLPVPSTMHLSAALPFHNKLWVMIQKDPTYYGSANSNPPQTMFSGNSLLNTEDGISWELVADSLMIPARTDCSLLEFQDKMWVIGGGLKEFRVTAGAGTLNISAIHSSTDGINWTNANPDANFLGRWLNAATIFGGKFWLSGTEASSPYYGSDATDQSTISVEYFANSLNGTTWSRPPHLDTPRLLLPRKAHAMTTHNNKLWIIGGYVNTGIRQSSSSTLFTGYQTSEVWSSTDGESWSLIDANAPFGRRVRFGSISFKNKLWVIAGQTNSESPGQKTDVWYYEEP